MKNYIQSTGGQLKYRMIAALISSILFSGEIRASGKADVLLLSCMDFRLIDETERYMTERGFRNNYDHVILAGASLGVLVEDHPAWGKTFWEHLDVAIQLHHEHKVVVMDHRDCGAYKLVFGEDYALDPEKETAVHTGKLNELKKLIQEKHPELEVELLLMNLSGEVEIID